MVMWKVPSLVDLCVQTAIDNISHLGDVGDTEYHLLERILSHCSLDQLKYIENNTEGRDLSPATDKLWERFYKDRFRSSFNTVVGSMRQEKVTFKWRQLYEAKEQQWKEAARKYVHRCKEEEAKKKAKGLQWMTLDAMNQAKLQQWKEESQKCMDLVKLQYQEEEEAKKRTRQVQLCTKVPPRTKRSYWGGETTNNIYNTKSSTMKKAKLEFVNSREVKNMKTKVVVHRNHGISFAKLYINKPSTVEIGAERDTLFPKAARLRNLSYSAQLYVDITQKVIKKRHDGEEDTENQDFPKVFIGKVPIMLKSKSCNLYQNSEKDLAELGDCGGNPDDWYLLRHHDVSLSLFE